MSKSSNKATNSKKKNRSNIEDKVDKILTKNKEKLKNFNLKNLDFEKFSLKNKDRDTIFYLKKKTKTESTDSTDLDLQNDDKEINKFSFDAKKKNKQFSFESDTNKDKKFREQEKSKDSAISSPSSPYNLRDLLDSKDFDMVISDINRLIDKDSKSKIKDDARIISKKDIKPSSEKDHFIEEKVGQFDSKSELKSSKVLFL